MAGFRRNAQLPQLLIKVFREQSPGNKGKQQLFDYATDPGELKNLAGDPQYAKVAAVMKGMLKKN